MCRAIPCLSLCLSHLFKPGVILEIPAQNDLELPSEVVAVFILFIPKAGKH